MGGRFVPFIAFFLMLRAPGTWSTARRACSYWYNGPSIILRRAPPGAGGRPTPVQPRPLLLPTCQNGSVTEGPDLAQGSGLADGGPSITARLVAGYPLGFTRGPAGYGDAAADETLAADVAAGEQPTGRMRDYLDARTRFFDRVVVGAIGRGVRQIVLGAAGYDGRAFRYAKRGVRWFEVDHPATQRDKQERLARLGLPTRRVRFVPADFARDPVADRLTAAGLDPGQPSLFLLEGVAVYLEPEVLERVLRQFRQVARPGSRLAISVSKASAG